MPSVKHQVLLVPQGMKKLNPYSSSPRVNGKSTTILIRWQHVKRRLLCAIMELERSRETG